MKTLFRIPALKTKLSMLIINLLVVSAFIISPYALKMFIDDIQLNHGKMFFFWVVIQVVIFLFQQIAFFLEDYLRGISEIEIWRKISLQLQSVFRFYDARKIEIDEKKIYQSLGQSYELIKDFIVYHPIRCLVNVLRLLVIFALIAYYSWVIAIILVVSVPIFLLLTDRFSNKITVASANSIKSMTEIKNYLVDVFKQSFSDRFQTNSTFRSIEPLLDDYSYKKKRSVQLEASFQNFMAYSFLNLLILIAIIVSGYQVIQGQMTFGTLVAIQLYVSGIWTPAEYLLDTYKGYISTKAIINDFAVMLETDQISYSLSTIESISVENLTLIGENGQHVISNLNFVFDNQNLNLITGPNGSGKTFLVHAILGMTQHYEGNISYSNFGFNNNISYIPGEPESSQYLNDSLPQTASFGQRKLSQIQRYLGEEKEVYIFDEPTNYLDLQHRKFVYEIIQDLVERGKIVVVISHDEEFKKFANVRILELEH